MTLLTLKVIRLTMIRRHHTCRILGMTAAAISWLPLINALIVASPAFCNPMRTTQRETRQVMIKPRMLPEILRVTILARHQLAIMRVILVVTLTALLTRSFQHPFVHMTIFAVQLEMNAGQQEVFMILRCILPPAFIMALGTERAIGPFMNILMASLTIALR
jgi:hypothetical protein